MKTRTTLFVLLGSLVLCILVVIFITDGSGPPINVERPYDNVVSLLSLNDNFKSVKLSQHKNTRRSTLTFQRQAIFWRGLRYRIRVREISPTTTELRGWVCDDNALVPGYNIFTKRPLDKESLDRQISAAEGMRRIEAANNERRREYAEQYGDMALNDRLLVSVSHPDLGKQAELDQTRELVARGANVNAVSLQGSTPLGRACFRAKDTDVIALLLDSGANPDLKGAGGWTALHIAAQSAPATIVRYLLDHGADPTVTTDAGETPLSVAVDSPVADQKTIELLRNVEAKNRID